MIADLYYIKKHFALWDKYFINENNEALDEILESEIELAEAEMAIYFPIAFDEANPAPEPIKFHLLNLVKKRGFDRRHGDTAFDNEPAIIKDYNQSIAELKRLRDSGGSFRLMAKPKRFNKWFNLDEDTV